MSTASASESQVQSRVHELEEENAQIREHMKQQSRQIQLLKQTQHGLELHDSDVESVKNVCQGLEEEIKSLKEVLKQKNKDIQNYEGRLGDAKKYQENAQDILKKVAVNIKVFKKENEELKSQLEAERAQSVTYKMDFDEERKDRTAIHSKYADLEKELATLKTEHVTTVQALSDQLDHQPLDHQPSASSDRSATAAVSEEMESELEQWKEEALSSREELLAKSNQVKAYKKQVDQFREKLDQAQMSAGSSEQNSTILDNKHLEAANAELKEEVKNLTMKLKDLESVLRNSSKEVTCDRGGHNDNIDDDDAPPLRAKDPTHMSHPHTSHTPGPLHPHTSHTLGPPRTPQYNPQRGEAVHQDDGTLALQATPQPPITLSQEHTFQSQPNNPVEVQPQAQNIMQASSNQHYSPSPRNIAPLQPLQYDPASQAPRPPVLQNNNMSMQPPATGEYVINQPQSYPQSNNAEFYQMQPQSSYNADSGYMSNQSNTSVPPPTVPAPSNSERNTPSASQEIESETEVDPNSTQLLIVHNKLQEDIDRDISEAAEDVTAVTREESEREGAPLDPNLVCPMCMKQHRLGEIQLFKAHVNKCDGSKR